MALQDEGSGFVAHKGSYDHLAGRQCLNLHGFARDGGAGFSSVQGGTYWPPSMGV